MALLNYTSEYNKINKYLNAASGSSDWLRIFVSPEASGGGHFITHGIDFSANYAAGKRGLIPSNTASDLTKTFFRGDGWKSFWNLADETASAVGSTPAQQLAAKELYLQSTIASVYDIKQWIQQSFVANDAMRFKGTISVDLSDNITHNTSGTSVSGFPTSCEVGDTYKVTGTTNKTLASQNVNGGDMLICIKDGSGSAINTSEYWTVVQSNIENLISYNLNGTEFHLYSSGSAPISLYAPIIAGIAGQVLISGGDSKSPTWVDANTLVVAQAGKVTNALLKGSGLSFKSQGIETNSYDGSAAITISLFPATSSTIGGVIIDGGTNSEAYKAPTNTDNTLYPTISAKNTGEIYLSKQNIINALGFTPGGSSKGIAKVIVGSNDTSNSNTTTAIINPYINIIANDNSVLGSYRISGNGKISVNSVANSADLTVSLGEADDSNYGGIKIGYTTTGKNYAVELNDGKAFVNVPWISDVFTSLNNGLVPAASDDNKSTTTAISTTYLLGADAKWYKLPVSAFQSDRRIVQLAGTNIIEANSGNALNIIAGKHINISAEQSSGNYTGKLTFDTVWRDIQVHLINDLAISSSVATIGDNDPLVFDNSESVFTLGEQVTSGSTNKTVIKSYITWYNMDTGEYEII